MNAGATAGFTEHSHKRNWPYPMTAHNAAMDLEKHPPRPRARRRQPMAALAIPAQKAARLRVIGVLLLL